MLHITTFKIFKRRSEVCMQVRDLMHQSRNSWVPEDMFVVLAVGDVDTPTQRLLERDLVLVPPRPVDIDALAATVRRYVASDMFTQADLLAWDTYFCGIEDQKDSGCKECAALRLRVVHWVCEDGFRF